MLLGGSAMAPPVAMRVRRRGERAGGRKRARTGGSTEPAERAMEDEQGRAQRVATGSGAGADESYGLL